MIYFLLTAAIIFIDQIAKIAIRTMLTEGQSIKVISDFFSLTYVRNDGAAFSSFRGQQLLLVAVSTAVVAVALIFLWKNRKKDKLLCSGLAMVAGGGAGNLIDRAFFGSVTDMFSFSIFPPVFNVADIGVVIGCSLIIVYSIVSERREKDKKRAKSK